MRVHALWRFVSATVLAATLASATEVSAQATSQQRIPVKKESGGDVVRRDSAARADSIAGADRRGNLAGSAAGASLGAQRVELTRGTHAKSAEGRPQRDMKTRA